MLRGWDKKTMRDKFIIKSVLNIDKTINVYSVGLDNVGTNSWL